MVTKDKNYNGWTNYETWAVALWIDNDYSNYEHRKELAKTFKDCHQYANALHEWIESQNPLAQDTSMFADLLSAALGEVDWLEIAENFLSE
jgi:hypothetical protein